MLRRQPTRSQGSRDKLPTETSQEPSFNFYLFWFFSPFSLFKSNLFHVRWSHGIPPLPLCPRAHPGWWDRILFSLRGAFCFHDHTNCNKLYKKTLASPKGLAATFFCTGQGQEALSSPPPSSYVSFGLFIFSTRSFRSLFTRCFLRCFFNSGFASCFLQNSR